MPSKSMPPSGTFVSYLHTPHTTELVLLIEKGIGLFLKGTFNYSCTLLLVLYFFLQHYTQNTKTFATFIVFPARFTNQYLQLLVGSKTFSYLKGTTIDLLHLGVIKILFWRRCRGALRYWQEVW